MSIIGGPVSILIVAAALIVGVIVWLTRRKEYPGVRAVGDDDGIDHEELQAAEREVRDLDVGQRPDEDIEGDDWGPGTAQRPRSPLEL